jgi:hypothetical protein
MCSTKSCVLAAVIVLVVLIIAANVYSKRPKGPPSDGGGFMPGGAATPKLREAVALLSGDLSNICQVADSVEGRGKKIEGDAGASDAAGEARNSLMGARRGMAEIVKNVKQLRATVGTMTPTYQNVLGLYRGLRDSDKQLWETAKALDLAGDRLQSLVGSSVDPLHQELGSAGAQLRQISSCLYSLVRSIHYLGGALQLE